MKHGDAVKDVAFQVEDLDAIFAVSRLERKYLVYRAGTLRGLTQGLCLMFHLKDGMSESENKLLEHKCDSLSHYYDSCMRLLSRIKLLTLRFNSRRHNHSEWEWNLFPSAST